MALPRNIHLKTEALPQDANELEDNLSVHYALLCIKFSPDLLNFRPENSILMLDSINYKYLNFDWHEILFEFFICCMFVLN